MLISLPYKVSLGFDKHGKDKSFYLNLNQYRNAHYHVLNKAKVVFKEQMTKAIQALPKLNKIEIKYTLYPASARDMDVSNTCSIVDKFFCDALVELSKLTDDNYKYLVKTSYEFGEIDRMNPRVDAEIKELEPMKLVFEKKEIIAALSMYASKVIALADAPSIELEATADGSFIARMDVDLASVQSSKAPAGFVKREAPQPTPASTNTRAAVAEALEAAKDAAKDEKPSLLNTTPEPAKPRQINIPKTEPAKEEAPAEAVAEDVAEDPMDTQDAADTTEATADAPATEEAKSGTITGNVDATPPETRSIFNFAKRT